MIPLRPNSMCKRRCKHGKHFRIIATGSVQDEHKPFKISSLSRARQQAFHREMVVPGRRAGRAASRYTRRSWRRELGSLHAVGKEAMNSTLVCSSAGSGPLPRLQIVSWAPACRSCCPRSSPPSSIYPFSRGCGSPVASSKLRAVRLRTIDSTFQHSNHFCFYSVAAIT